LDKWEGIVMMNSLAIADVNIKNFIPRGCVIHDTPYVIGIVVYVGTDTKINQSSDKIKPKESWLMEDLNKITYSVFVVQFGIILTMSVMNTIW
jgi:magnesium-transporting ATPase (P-type)